VNAGPESDGGMVTRPALADLLRESQLVDLSLILSDDLPCYWPGAARYRHTTDHWFENLEGRPGLRRWSGTPYHSCVLELDEHTGTHFDAPAHFIPPPESGLAHAGPAGLLTAEAIDLAQLIGNAVVVDVSSLVGHAPKGASPRIEPGLLDEFEARHGPIGAGDIVLFRSGWDERYLPGDSGDRYVRLPVVFRSEPAWPAPEPATIAWLLERGVRCVGTDGVSMGPAEDGLATHITGLSAGMVFVEALTRLHELPTRGATFIFLPLAIAGGSGGPGRALGVITAQNAGPEEKR
jgi:isatin hydrolase